MTRLQSVSDSSKNVKRIFFMVLLAIVADQTVESVLLEIIGPRKFSFGNITNTYLLCTVPFALLLAAWSDFHCRRKTMIFSLTCLSISGLLATCFQGECKDWIIFAALAFKGIGGNVTPIALASLATIVPPKKFTIYLAIAICAYSIGLWVPIYLHSFEQLPLTATIIAIGSTLIIIRWFREREFDDFKFQNNTASLRKFFTFFRKDILSILLFGISVSVMLALFGFLATEVGYYQILLRGEVVGMDLFYSELSLKMATSYYFGTLLLYLLLRKNISEIRCLAAGTISALASIFLTAIFHFTELTNPYLITFSFAFFSIGFALMTPCLFSILSQIRRKDEQGKIYGFLDTYDTLGAYISVKYISITTTVSFNHALWFSFIILFIAAIFIFAFIRDVQERENLSIK